ncbi:type II restriction endonuclease [Aeromicrobium sp. 179-A 4D2 NHS]|uniref:type II restriction endonuclease n=1 Tax=Aeromicrobium sp. 179-A 4D2 NHS TaxID=3142375 RepID=UPI0039A3F508
MEIDPTSSNQHEFQATIEMQRFLGPPVPRREIATRFVYLDDDEPPLVCDVIVKYYDARERHPSRSEARIYYPDNKVIRVARPGDVLVFAVRPDGDAAVIIARAGCSTATQLLWLFNFDRNQTQRFTAADDATFKERLTSFDAEVLLDVLGIEATLSDESDVELVEARFGDAFPSTAEFSAFAREQSDAPDPRDDADACLIRWWETEYRLFQALERSIVEKRLAVGFSGSEAVEDFISFSLGVQNRRKSRSGHAFENHLAAIFTARGVAYERGAVTERKAKPDFLFPSSRAYTDPTFPGSELRMLGAKTTSKDRWRQVLTEADRIPVKHLASLQPAISEAQTSEMRALGVQLVLPRELHRTYTPAQQGWLWTLTDFILEVGG